MHPLIILAAAGGLAYAAKRKWFSQRNDSLQAIASDPMTTDESIGSTDSNSTAASADSWRDNNR